ncbi:MAG: VWA domain-containing protein [Bryobacterales bacterium]|nr:VWA domain-containing protein [Bryobacterales bacterium]
MRTARTLVAGLAFLTLARPQVPSDSARQRAGEPTFRAEVRVVNVYATVKNGTGQVLTDLTENDLILWEDGFVQDISHFSWVADAPLDIGLLVDTSLSQAALLPTERRTGLQFLRSVLRPDQDRAFLVKFDRDVELVVEPTGNLRDLSDGLDNLHVRPYAAPQGPPTPGRRTGTALFDAVYLASAEVFQERSRRRVAVVISDGYDTGSIVSLRRAVRESLRADVVVYSIQFLDEAIAGMIYADRIGAGSAALNRISSQTGGSFHRVSRNVTLEEVFRKIEDEMRGAYSLGYTPSRGFADPGYRRIKVTSPRMEVRTIQARDGYDPHLFLQQVK